MQSWPAPDLPKLPGGGPSVQVRDTESGSLTRLDTSRPTTLYVCGITPYDATHLGHAFTYLTYDLLTRAVLDAGGEVAYVQNVTDVDDPLLERAERDGVRWHDLASAEIDRYRSDMAALRIIPPRDYVGVVEAVPLIVEMIAELAERGAVYNLDGDLYFSVASDPRFGYVSRLAHADMVTASGENGGDPGRAGKKDPVDPLLWRAERPGEPAWPSPFGPGRPGWHIECSAIARRYLGDTIDVQGGGRDLVFPHHESSAAHAEVATGAAPFARAYVHAGLVAMDGHKMSKSRGNLEFVSRLRGAGVDPAALRLALLGFHYRGDWEWKPAVLEAAVERLARWRAAFAARRGASANSGASGDSAASDQALLATVRERLADDLDAPGALAGVDRWADAVLAGASIDPPADSPRLVRDTVCTLLGLDLSAEES